MVLHATPRLPRRLLTRQRLLDRLDAETPIVVLQAPAGHGKSVLLTQWAQHTDADGVFARVEQAPDAGRRLREDLCDGLRAIGLSVADGASWRSLTRVLRADERSLVFAVDGAERLAAEDVSALAALAADLPRVRLRVATRSRGPLADSALAARVDIDIVGARELVLTAAEARKFARDRAEAPVLDDGIPPLLAWLASAHGTDAARSVLDACLADAPDDLVAFVETIALAGSVEVPLARQLSGSDRAQELLDAAELAGIGQWDQAPPRSERARFTIARPFREVLSRRASERLDGARLRKLTTIITDHELAAGRVYTAVRGAIATGDWELVGHIARDHWMQLYVLGLSLARLLRRVPPAAMREHPHLLMLLALAYEIDEVERPRALEFFSLAAAAAKRQRSRVGAGDRAYLLAIESCARRSIGDYAGARHAATLGYEGMRALDSLDTKFMQDSMSTIWVQLGSGLAYGGDYEDALSCFRRAAADVGTYRLGLKGIASEAGVHAVVGDIPAARAAIARADGYRWPAEWASDHHGCPLVLARVCVALEGGEIDEAEAQLATIAAHRDSCEHWVHALQLEVTILLLRGLPDDAWHRMNIVVRAQRRRYRSTEAAERLLQGTRSLIAAARGAAVSAGHAEGVVAAVVRARTALASGDLAGVLGLHLLDRAALSPRMRAEVDALVTAALCLIEPDSEAAVQSLRDLDAELAVLELWLPLVQVPLSGLEAMERVGVRCALPGLDRIRRAREAGVLGRVVDMPALTARERAVARELVRRAGVADIGAALTVSPNTVKTQLRSLYRKLGVGSRQEAVRRLAELGLHGTGMG
ncbi:MAG: LuxR C-terminal-related transcriptional regulator [Microbacterium sp.]